MNIIHYSFIPLRQILIDIASKKKDLEEIDERKKQILKLEENVLVNKVTTFV